MLYSFMFVRKLVSAVLVITLLISPEFSYAQSLFVSALPEPGKMVGVSPAFTPVLLKGLVVYPDKPLNFSFIVESGNDLAEQPVLKEQSERMVRYFLAALTVPENQLWVNLSPYEKDRIIEERLGETVLGRDMLAQDYVLKQLTASLIYPEDNLGKDFWARIYSEAREKFGTTDIPVDTFNKVWIMPEKAEVFEKGNAVYVTQAKLKVMLDSDYVAMGKNVAGADLVSSHSESADISKQLIRQIILPAIEKEVNEGKNFATLRQVYYAAILAKWYRELIQDTLMAKEYVGTNKVSGVTTDEKALKEEIYQRYIAAYKQGVFNYIKEEPNTVTGDTTPKKYFSGGVSGLAMTGRPLDQAKDMNSVVHKGRAAIFEFAMFNANEEGAGVKSVQRKGMDRTDQGGGGAERLQQSSFALAVSVAHISIKDVLHWMDSNFLLTISVVASLSVAAVIARRWWLRKAEEARLIALREEVTRIVQEKLAWSITPPGLEERLIDLAYKIRLEGKQFMIFLVSTHPTPEYKPLQEIMDQYEYKEKTGKKPLFEEWSISAIANKKDNSESFQEGGIDIKNIAVTRTDSARIRFNEAELMEVFNGRFDGFTPVFIKMTLLDSPRAIFGAN